MYSFIVTTVMLTQYAPICISPTFIPGVKKFFDAAQILWVKVFNDVLHITKFYFRYKKAGNYEKVKENNEGNTSRRKRISWQIYVWKNAETWLERECDWRVQCEIKDLELN